MDPRSAHAEPQVSLSRLSRQALMQRDRDLQQRIDAHFLAAASGQSAESQWQGAQVLIQARAAVLTELRTRDVRRRRQRGASWIAAFFLIMGAAGVVLAWLTP